MSNPDSDAQLLIDSLDLPKYWQAYNRTIAAMETMDTLERLFVAALLGTYIRKWLEMVAPNSDHDALMVAAVKAAGRLAERRQKRQGISTDRKPDAAVKPSPGLL